MTDEAPWIALLLFTLVCLIGAVPPLGCTGFVPYRFVVWVIAAITLSRLRPPLAHLQSEWFPVKLRLGFLSQTCEQRERAT